jgi:hypothetical protein
MPDWGIGTNIPDTNDDGTPGGENDMSLGEAYNSIMPGDTDWIEAYTRAATGGLIDPSTGSNAFVDTDGDFYQDGVDYDGPTGAFETIQGGATIVGNEGVEQSQEVLTDAIDVGATVTSNVTGGIWGAIPTWVKAGGGLIITVAILWLIRPLLGLADSVTG